ncbi:putative subtilisin inhibitor 1 [Tripterygium wilfordii]|uniref:Putative subtilisin inhibitor 1 n=1 Tax=Tripterygium wilfordii TaxID=458696 RepID=A0A7J7DX27_TRIWF|nr:subtilisin inhibitor CLSI-I-like [Tripterygium wilfordii]KAF5750915.1 putative subtilisin inhibitor 1 [Tripterygium wilfordii]
MADENQKSTSPAQEEAGESTNLQLPRTYGQLLGSNAPGKSEWPELVGVTALEAENKIKEEMIGAEVRVVQPNCFVTCDWKSNRVRLYIDTSGKVARPPRIG